MFAFLTTCEEKRNRSIELFRNVKSSLKCNVCARIAIKPYRLLPCRHIFCINCLNPEQCPKCKCSTNKNKPFIVDETAANIVKCVRQIDILNKESIEKEKESIEKEKESIEKEKESIKKKKESIEKKKASNKSQQTSLNKSHTYSTRLSTIKKLEHNDPSNALNKKNSKGETCLQLACIKNDFQTVENLLKEGASVNVKDNAGWTPLHEAVEKNNISIVQLLIDAGAIINAPGYFYITALEKAVTKNNSEMVNLLMKHGANSSSKNYEGYNCRDLASQEMLKIMNEVPVMNLKPFQLPTIGDFVLYFDDKNFSSENLKHLKLLNFQVVEELNYNKITHIIVPEVDLMLKNLKYYYLQAIIQGVPLCSLTWIKDSLKESTILNPYNYFMEGYENMKTHMIHRSQENKYLMHPKIFDGIQMHVLYATGSKNQTNIKGMPFDKLNMESLIQLGDGKILKREPHERNITSKTYYPWHAQTNSSIEICTLYIIYNEQLQLRYNMQELKHMPYEWIIKCILHHSLVSPELVTF